MFTPWGRSLIDPESLAMAVEPLFFDLTDSPLGRAGLVWTEGDGLFKVLQVFLPRRHGSIVDVIRQAHPGARRRSGKNAGPILEGIGRILLGRPFEYHPSILKLDACTDFQRLVLLEERKVPRGRVSTYGRIAARLGRPRGARAVGSALAANPFPLLIPCHRAVRSNGDIGGFQGGPDMKRALLEMEGVRFDGAGRVEPSFFW